MLRGRVLVGRVGRVYGVRGLVRLLSYTQDPARLVAYCPLFSERGECYRVAWSKPGIARLYSLENGIERPIVERRTAAALVNCDLFAARDALPPPAPDEYYLADLIGLEAFEASGRALGRVRAVHDYGGGASLEIGTILVPFTAVTVPEVDLERGRIVVAAPVIVPAR